MKFADDFFKPFYLFAFVLHFVLKGSDFRVEGKHFHLFVQYDFSILGNLTFEMTNLL